MKQDEIESAQYVPPEVDVQQVQVERGYSDSDPGGIALPDMPATPL